MKYLVMAVDFLFGCHHGRLSRVFTITGDTYRVCFDCGAKFGYSLKTMSTKPSNKSQGLAANATGWKGTSIDARFRATNSMP